MNSNTKTIIIQEATTVEGSLRDTKTWVTAGSHFGLLRNLTTKSQSLYQQLGYSGVVFEIRFYYEVSMNYKTSRIKIGSKYYEILEPPRVISLISRKATTVLVREVKDV